MLRMWLSDLDQNSLSVLLGADFMVSGDWMFLALSAMGRLFLTLLPESARFIADVRNRRP